MEDETYKGKYIRQDADIDLAGNSDHPGIGKKSTFAATFASENAEPAITHATTLLKYVARMILRL